MKQKNLKISELKLNLPDISCASCVFKIEKKLQEHPAVKEIKVDLISQKANVKFDKERLSEETIKKIINDLGYKTVSTELTASSKEKEIQSIRKKFFLSLLLGLPLLFFALTGIFKIEIPAFLVFISPFVQLLLTGSIIFLSFSIWKKGFLALLRKNPDMDSLIFIGTFTAFFFSLYGFFSKVFLEETTFRHLYFDSAAFILIFVSLGKYLEKLTRGRTNEAIEKLIKLQPQFATLVKEGKKIKIPFDQIRQNDVLLVKTGEKIPVDGNILEGEAWVDEQMITGESLPIFKEKGNEVFGLTLNKSGLIKIKAQKIGKDTLVSQIIKVVEEALNKKSKMQIFADRVAFYFVPTILILAVLSFIFSLFFFKNLDFAFSNFVAVLIIACPCALGLATPTALVTGLSLAAERGILIRNTDSLEKAEKIDTIVFDKTGTLTLGEPEIVEIETKNEKMSAKEALLVAHSLESYSNHPLALAFLKKAKEAELDSLEIKNFKEVPGKGLSGEISNDVFFLGNERFVLEKGVSTFFKKEILTEKEKEGKTIIFLAKNRELIAFFTIFDQIKKEAKEAVLELNSMGKKIILLTGDQARVAKSVAFKLKIKNYIAEVLPQEKSKVIEKLKREGGKILMVGDGINDAPALASADLGIALGSGSDIAMETGEIVLVQNDLRKVKESILISQLISKKIKQNLFWAFFYNVLAIPIASGVLFPLTGWLLSPSLAALAMVFSSLSVVLNSLSLKNKK